VLQSSVRILTELDCQSFCPSLIIDNLMFAAVSLLCVLKV